MNDIQLARLLGLASLGLGGAEVAAGRPLSRQLGIGKHELVDAFGVREIGTGLAVLTYPDNPWPIWGRVAGDVMDLALLASALGSGNRRRHNAAWAAIFVLGITLVDVACATMLTRRHAARRADRAPHACPPQARRAVAEGDPGLVKVHHFNAGAMQPYGGALFDGATPGFGPANLTCHCLLLETSAGLVLVDTGTVSRDAVAAGERLDPFFRITDRVRLIPGEAAFNRIAALGHNPGDVKHIVMTHLDFDHAAGLVDFPGATVHLSAAEAAAARKPTSWKERARYRPAQWGNQGNWHLYDSFAADLFGLRAAYIEGVPGVMLVALPGHTKGHCGVAVNLDPEWLLHAGDAIFNHRELDPAAPSTPTGARLYQWFMETSQVQRRRSLAALRRIRRDEGDHVQIICTHDPALLARAATEASETRERSPYSGG